MIIGTQQRCSQIIDIWGHEFGMTELLESEFSITNGYHIIFLKLFPLFKNVFCRYKWMTYGEASTARSAIGSALVNNGIPKASYCWESLLWILADIFKNLSFFFHEWLSSLSDCSKCLTMLIGILHWTILYQQTWVANSWSRLLCLFFCFGSFIRHTWFVNCLFGHSSYIYIFCSCTAELVIFVLWLLYRSRCSKIHRKSCIYTSHILCARDIKHCKLSPELNLHFCDQFRFQNRIWNFWLT